MRPTLRHIVLLFTAAAMIFTAACRKSTPQESGPTPHTLMFYFTGTQLSYYFDRNIDAAASAVARGDAGNCRVLCFYQGSSRKSASIVELRGQTGNVRRRPSPHTTCPP